MKTSQLCSTNRTLLADEAASCIDCAPPPLVFHQSVHLSILESLKGKKLQLQFLTALIYTCCTLFHVFFADTGKCSAAAMKEVGVAPQLSSSVLQPHSDPLFCRTLSAEEGTQTTAKHSREASSEREWRTKYRAA